MKLYAAAIFLASCYRAPIAYSGGRVTPPQITCVYCDTLPKNVTADGGLNVYGDSVKLGGVIHRSTSAQDGVGIADFAMDSDGNIVWGRDSSAEWMRARLTELEDSIRLIKKQTAWLDSMNHSMDTVKWTPYYYKPKKK